MIIDVTPKPFSFDEYFVELHNEVNSLHDEFIYECLVESASDQKMPLKERIFEKIRQFIVMINNTYDKIRNYISGKIQSMKDKAAAAKAEKEAKAKIDNAQKDAQNNLKKIANNVKNATSEEEEKEYMNEAEESIHSEINKSNSIFKEFKRWLKLTV